MKSLLSVKQVVQRLNGAVSAKLIYKLAAQGKLRTNRRLGKLLIEEDSLIELLEPRGPPPVPEMPPPPRRPRGRPKKEKLELW
ncbi:MAG: helix-turn-helix domain-containing protein [Hyphomonadaceae bacterium]|nr:helix-turn-helix domain-containing protein [Hyphomonadaceae bacterium]